MRPPSCLDLDLTGLQADFLAWFQDDLQINQGSYMARNNPGLEGFNLMYQLWAHVLLGLG